MPLKIFVIDDEESIRISLKWHLEDLGHLPHAVGVPLAEIEIHFDSHRHFPS